MNAAARVGVTPMETRREVVLHARRRAPRSSATTRSTWPRAGATTPPCCSPRSRPAPAGSELGTGVLNVWGRSPASIAMLARACDGCPAAGSPSASARAARSSPRACTTSPFRRPGRAARRDGPAGARAAGRGAAGRTSTGARGRCGWRPPRPRLPMHLAALGPAAVRLAGEVADGWCPFLLPLSGLKERIVPAGGGAAARPGAPRPRSPGRAGRVAPDPAPRRTVAAWWVAFYLTSMGPLYATHAARAGVRDGGGRGGRGERARRAADRPGRRAGAGRRAAAAPGPRTSTGGAPRAPTFRRWCCRPAVRWTSWSPPSPRSGRDQTRGRRSRRPR